MVEEEACEDSGEGEAETWERRSGMRRGQRGLTWTGSGLAHALRASRAEVILIVELDMVGEWGWW
jgi:hypothetical protein